MRAAALLAILFVAPLLPSASAASFTVTASNFQWSPASIQIDPGDSITFTNASTNAHTWVRDDGTDSCSLPCTRTFSAPGSIGFHCGIHTFMTARIQVGPPANVTITSPAAGASVSGLVHVTGTASHATDTIASVTVRFDSGTSVNATLSAQNATSVTWSADVDSRGLANGAHTLNAHATTSLGLAADASESVNVANLPRIDLVETFVSAPSAAIGTSLTITWQVRNDGNNMSGAFTVRAEYFYHGTWRKIGDVGTPSLTPGSTRTGQIAWSRTTPLVGTFPIRVTADPDGAIADVDRSNNARDGNAGWFTSSVSGLDPTEPV